MRRDKDMGRLKWIVGIHRVASEVRPVLFLCILVFLASPSWAGEPGVFRMTAPIAVSNEAPLHYSDSRRVMVFFQTTPEAVRRLVPQPLVPNPNNVMGIMACHWSAAGFRNREYNDAGGKIFEAALVVPVRFGKQDGAYIVILYVDNASRLPMSREIWGFPKKLADVAIEEKGGTFSSTVKIGGREVLKLNFQRIAKVEPVPPSPPGVVYNLKQIPSVRRNAPPEVLQLTSVKTNFRMKEFWRGKATLELGSSSQEPLREIPVLKVLSASESIIDGSMDYGEVLHDYLDGAGK